MTKSLSFDECVQENTPGLHIPVISRLSTTIHTYAEGEDTSLHHMHHKHHLEGYEWSTGSTATDHPTD